MREFKIENYLVARVEAEGGKCVKFTSSNNRGVPDRLCLFPLGVYLFVECKATGKTLDPLQKEWFDILLKLGQPRVMIDSMTQVDAIIRWYRIKAKGVKRLTPSPTLKGEGNGQSIRPTTSDSRNQQHKPKETAAEEDEYRPPFPGLFPR